jgi:antitoxin component of MazEF toxin-antitoxin module
MRQQIVTLAGSAALPLPPEIMSALGMKAGDTVELVLDGRQLRVQPVAYASRGARLAAMIDDVFERRREAYEQLAEGP